MYRVLYITVVFIQLIIVAIVASSNNGINAESINKTAINTSSVVKPGAGSKNPKEDREAVLVDRTS